MGWLMPWLMGWLMGWLMPWLNSRGPFPGHDLQESESTVGEDDKRFSGLVSVTRPWSLWERQAGGMKMKPKLRPNSRTVRLLSPSSQLPLATLLRRTRTWMDET
ncbi:hypothetical protein PMIN03_009637 [Paraphaeosphaeria minitans]